MLKFDKVVLTQKRLNTADWLCLDVEEQDRAMAQKFADQLAGHLPSLLNKLTMTSRYSEEVGVDGTPLYTEYECSVFVMTEADLIEYTREVEQFVRAELSMTNVLMHHDGTMH